MQELFGPGNDEGEKACKNAERKVYADGNELSVACGFRIRLFFYGTSSFAEMPRRKKGSKE